MAPTLLPGDCVFVELTTYRLFRNPNRGEVVVFFPPGEIEQERERERGGEVSPTKGKKPLVEYVKRAVAIEGDTVEVRGGKVFVNGNERKEEGERYQRRPYGTDPRKKMGDDKSLLQAKYNLPVLRVPPKSLFVLGDNRNRSVDSHVWGFLPTENLVGKCWFRWWPLDRLGVL